MKNKRRSVYWALRASLLLLCLVLATLGLAVGLHARYTTGAVASDGARVARFKITETGLDDAVLITASMAPGDATTKTFTVQNESEVAVEYSITVRNTTDNLPLQFYVEGDASNKAAGEYIFSAELAPMSAEKNYTLNIQWPEDMSSTSYVGMVDKVAVSISAVQID